MDYNFNSENLIKIINFNCVPSEEALYFDIDKSEISIRKAYFDEEENEAGNSLCIIKENLEIDLQIIFGELYGMYNANNTSWETLNDTSPKYVIEFVNDIWPKIIIDLEEREKCFNGYVEKLTLEDFKLQFEKYTIPRDLKMLFDFENEYGSESFSECFYLNAIDKTGLKSWCDKKDFLNSFIEFATANGSGSTYAYWLVEKDIEKCPIVVFGDEGGIHIVASSTKDLIHLLTYDIEIMVDHEEATFYKDEEDYEKSENKKEFVKWAKENFDLKAIKNEEETEKIISNAKNKFQDKLNLFLEGFGIEL
jgi:hypothetical protein